MEEILSKRIMLLTNTLIVLCGIGFLTLIHRLDASFKAKEYEALNKLRNCVESLPNDAGDPGVMAAAARDWLQRARPEFHDKNFRFNVMMTEDLQAEGFGHNVRAIKGGTDGRKDFALLYARVSDTANCCEHGLGNLNGNNKLNHFIEQYNHIRKPVTVVVASSMQPQALKQTLQNDTALARLRKLSDPALHRDHYYSTLTLNIESVRLEGDSITIAFGIASSMMQINPQGPKVRVPVKTEKTEGASLYEVYNIAEDFNALQESDELEKLREHYGELPMDKVIDLVGADYMEAYESIDVLGFSFSTTSMPLALLCFLLFTSVGLYLMVREGVKKDLKVFSYENEDITDYFLKRRWIRLFVWLVLPFLALAATLPNLPVEDLKLYLLSTGATVLLAVNFMTLMMARKL